MPVSVQISGCELKGLGNIPKNAENSFQYLLLRLLLGTSTVCRGGIEHKQKIDYSVLPAVVQNKSPGIAVKDFLTTSIGGSVARFIKATTGDNREFYKEILCEFLNFHIQTQRNSDTAAFVFLYRILERFSYFVPLLYAATQTDYRGTFNDLKAILNSDMKVELGLFKKLLQKGKFIDPLKLQIPQKILFATGNANGTSYYNLTENKCKGFVTLDPLNKEIEIKFLDIPDLIITMRNRFFHALIGDASRTNVTTIEMIDSDEYFRKLNPIIVSFLSIIILQTLSAKYHT
jgi:hypothetical protein